MSDMTPVELSVQEPNKLLIVWSDGQRREYPFAELRSRCPCATCREKRNAEQEPNPFAVISQTEAQPVRIAGMQPVGNYAYQITFSDGHDTGIFTIDFLRELGQIVAE